MKSMSRNMGYRQGWQTLLSLCALCLLTSFAFAQASTTGKLTGTVTDAAGAVVPNAQITVVSDAT